MKRCNACGAVENDDAKALRLSLDVLRALDVGLGRDVALEIISPMFAASQGMAERFQREARALASLASISSTPARRRRRRRARADAVDRAARDAGASSSSPP